MLPPLESCARLHRLGCPADGYDRVVQPSDHESRDADVEMNFGHDVGAPRQARRALDPLLSDPGDPIADDVKIVASELVSNVVQHTIDGGRVRAWDPKPDKPFHLEVSDDDVHSPQPPEAASDHGGRGLRIVEELSDACGVDVDENGKTAWADFNRPT